MPLIFAMLFSLAAVGFAFYKGESKRKQQVILLLLPFLLSLGGFFLVGLYSQKNFWPRHLSAAFPFYVIAAALFLSGLHSAGGFRKIVSRGLVCMMLISCLMLRFAPQHKKDDYKNATRNALSSLQSGKVVWWSADKQTARYYGLDFNLWLSLPATKLVADIPSWPKVLESPLPDEIYYTRPYIYDSEGHLRKFMEKNQFSVSKKLPSFEVWTKN
jgi:hypothetical protein